MSIPQLSVHLSFNGNCAQAFQAYKDILGGQIEMLMPYGESPAADQVPAEHATRLLHASMRLGDQRIMGADAAGDHPYGGSTGYSLSLNYPTVEEAQRIYTALGEGGSVIMPFGPTFWAKGFGIVTDRFGVSWMVGSEQPPQAG